MTTVAYDGTTLAADTQSTCHGYLKMTTHKLWRLSSGALLGGCGSYQDLLQAVGWLEDPTLPKPIIREDDGFTCLLVEPDGQVFRLEEQLMRTPVHEPFSAIGSGQDFALAAMALGKTAVEAVELAMRFDCKTGGDVETLTLEEDPHSFSQMSIKMRECVPVWLRL